MKKKHHYLSLFLTFFRIGILGYGGGPSFIPLVYLEVVNNKKWISDDEFNDVLAIGNTLPGPISTKMAGYIGWKLAGLLGIIITVSALVLPTALAVVILLTSMAALHDLSWVQGMRKSIPPVIGVMLGIIIYQFMNQSLKEMGWFKSSAIFWGALLLMVSFDIHPGLIIILIILGALLWPVYKDNSEVQGN